jgi:Carboxypeptidase regulatory-like domain
MARFCTATALWPVLVAVVTWTSAAALAAQETVHLASVGGRVIDPQGAVVPGAAVTIVHLDTNVTRDAMTTADGRFRFPYLPVGPYSIVVSKPGFADSTQTLALSAGAAFELSVALNVASIDTRVTVSAAAPVIDAARSQIAGTVTQSEVRSMPLNGRNFLDLALLVPGVSPTNIGSTPLFAETSAVPGAGLSVASQRNFSNNVIVDGLSANDDAAGLSGIPVGVDAVEQVQVITSGGQAELGRALGGYVNVVTRSGTNRSRGDAYTYLRDRHLNAANALLGRALPMTQTQTGVSGGGPIRRDRTFYFGNVEWRQLNQTGLTTIRAEDVATINAGLRANGYPGAPVSSGVYPNPVDTVNLVTKIDHQFSGTDQVSVRYSVYDVSSANARGAGALNAPSASAGLDNRDQAIGVGNTISLSPRTVNDTRAQIARGTLFAPPSDPIGPAVSIAGVAVFGTLSSSPTGRENTLYQVVDNFSHSAGAHAVRAGVDFLYNDSTITFPRSTRGAYTFASLNNFLSGVYNNAGFTQTFGDTSVSQTNPNLGLYAQDEWKLGSTLTFNAGLRYDLQFLDRIETDRNNVSPRLGVAWAPSGSRRTVIRGSAGTFYDRVPLRTVANALLSADNTTDLTQLRQIGVSLSPAQLGAPIFPQILPAAVPTTTPVNFTTIDRHLQNARSRQASVELEQQFGARTTVSVGYQYLRGIDLLIQINQNVPACVATGSNNGCRPNPAYGNNNQYSSEASSTYHGLFVSLLQRPSSWGSYRVSYTLSKSMNNVGESFFSSPIDPFDLSKDWARSDDDQRHRLVVNGTIATPREAADAWWQHLTHGLQMSAVAQYYSALPYNITSGVTTVQATAGRPIVDGAFISRNAGVGTSFFSLGARLARTFRIYSGAEFDAVIEGFNLTNRVNVVSRNANFGAGAYPSQPAATFNQVTAVGEPRMVQLAARLRF